ncbi:Uu.00g076860.m01.CDS01 [Anthostomella pinea]|uniref:Uu.00g076860.m01.CDS01 n=1 Tax=Anthostomella pinea TaxID=933095 RepID=A0AAI8VVY7_9PEZI|nr:Uu.00g076860.m01.CDS01 [Anthostomella pinea]
MVTHESHAPSGAPKPSGPYEPYRGPPNQFNMGARRFSSIPLMVLLYSAAMPFTPVGWLFPVEGAFIVDRLCAGLIVLCACWFQWQISGLNHAITITIPGPSRQTIRSGRMDRSGGGGMMFIWQTSNYWPYAACETLLLVLAEFGPSEILRRSIVCGVLAGLWIVGFNATPRSYRIWAWEQIKALWFWIVLRELLDVGRANVARRSRRY